MVERGRDVNTPARPVSISLRLTNGAPKSYRAKTRPSCPPGWVCVWIWGAACAFRPQCAHRWQRPVMVGVFGPRLLTFRQQSCVMPPHTASLALLRRPTRPAATHSRRYTALQHPPIAAAPARPLPARSFFHPPHSPKNSTFFYSCRHPSCVRVMHANSIRVSSVPVPTQMQAAVPKPHRAITSLLVSMTNPRSATVSEEHASMAAPDWSAQASPDSDVPFGRGAR